MPPMFRRLQALEWCRFPTGMPPFRQAGYIQAFPAVLGVMVGRQTASFRPRSFCLSRPARVAPQGTRDTPPMVNRLFESSRVSQGLVATGATRSARSGRLRVGAVQYLNTKPLVHGLAKHGIEFGVDLPSRLADRLANGQLDVALIPSIELFRGDRYRVISDACIACRGPVMSVKLFFRTQPGKVARLAVDEGSRASAALARILLAERFGVPPTPQTRTADPSTGTIRRPDPRSIGTIRPASRSPGRR